MSNALLAGLNPEQLAAVTLPKQSALILAGVLVANLPMTVYATELADAAAALRARR